VQPLAQVTYLWRGRSWRCSSLSSSSSVLTSCYSRQCSSWQWLHNHYCWRSCSCSSSSASSSSASSSRCYSLLRSALWCLLLPCLLLLSSSWAPTASCCTTAVLTTVTSSTTGTSSSSSSSSSASRAAAAAALRRVTLRWSVTLCSQLFASFSGLCFPVCPLLCVCAAACCLLLISVLASICFNAGLGCCLCTSCF
jgi:hypothetical protein